MRRRFFECFQEGVRALHVQAVGGDDDGDFVFGFGGLEVDVVHEVAHLRDADGAGFGFGPDPMDIGVVAVGNFFAVGAVIAGIDGDAVLAADGVLAI